MTGVDDLSERESTSVYQSNVLALRNLNKGKVLITVDLTFSADLSHCVGVLSNMFLFFFQ